MDAQALAEVLGITGAVIYLLSYAILQYKREFAKTTTYTLMNLVAASLVLYSTVYFWNAATAIINLSWIIISLYGLKRCLSYKSEEMVEPRRIELPTS